MTKRSRRHGPAPMTKIRLDNIILTKQNRNDTCRRLLIFVTMTTVAITLGQGYTQYKEYVDYHIRYQLLCSYFHGKGRGGVVVLSTTHNRSGPIDPGAVPALRREAHANAQKIISTYEGESETYDWFPRLERRPIQMLRPRRYDWTGHYVNHRCARKVERRAFVHPCIAAAQFRYAYEEQMARNPLRRLVKILANKRKSPDDNRPYLVPNMPPARPVSLTTPAFSP
uniref:Uncharacterized protein n=1 Tax=Branchiostoma floridae TaxID=7739 RepID=C3Z712_BRAFL|eukprot:XP_002595596.1 hypothetical protein BRAFLDRAFT_64706 [Branchiostoma floridae]